jgi:uncharacterized DUF497 family protein
VKIEFDRVKRATTLRNRGLDFLDAAAVFEGSTFTMVDDRADYGETRWITAGQLRGRMVVVVWPHRGDVRRIISMRKANEREQERFRIGLGRSG